MKTLKLSQEQFRLLAKVAKQNKSAKEFTIVESQSSGIGTNVTIHYTNEEGKSEIVDITDYSTW